jgi:hypothetical protein
LNPSPHPSTKPGQVRNLAQLLKKTNRLADAEPTMRRALESTREALAQTIPNSASTTSGLLEERGDWRSGVELHGHAKPIMIGHGGGATSDRGGLAKAMLSQNT